MSPSRFSRAAGLGLATATLAALALPVAASAAGKGPVVWAHRGGSYVNGKATYPENTLPAFTAAAKQGFVLELDVQLTQDRVPLVIHDDDLDRTTPCTGKVADRTYADIRANCKSDVLGSPSSGPLGDKATTTTPKIPLPTLAEVLKVAKKHGVGVAPELKQFDASGATGAVTAKAIKASKIPLRLVTVQLFPPNLTAFHTLLPSVKLSQLTISEPVGALDLAVSSKAQFVSPQFVAGVDSAYMKQAKGLGLQVAPYTLDTAAEVKRAKKLGVAALITNDPSMARKALGQKAPKAKKQR